MSTAAQMIAAAKRDADAAQVPGTMANLATHIGILQGMLRGQEMAFTAPVPRWANVNAVEIPYGEGRAVAHYEYIEGESAVNDVESRFAGPGFPADASLIALYVRGLNIYTELDQDQIERIEEKCVAAHPKNEVAA